MKLIKPNFEILEPTGYDINSVKKFIEICGRTCYKSEDKITEDSAKTFVDGLIKSGHGAMLEHGTIYMYLESNPDNRFNYHVHENIGFTVPYNWNNVCHAIKSRYNTNKYSKSIGIYDRSTYKVYVTTNLRVLIENNWLDDLKFICDPTEHHIKRVTVKFTCNRQVSHEFVRHRVFSFAQESTRYCNYTKDKFGNELTFIEPCWNYKDENGYDGKLIGVLQEIENRYISMINSGWKPQQAATILPNALKTELIMTGFVEDWKHFFKLRADSHAHPQAQELAYPLKYEFIKRGYIDE